jgi:hypothetical protein
VSSSRDDLARLAELLGDKARELAAVRYPTGAGSASTSPAPGDLDAVQTATELAAIAAEALRTSVDLARAAGRTWQELGDVLGVTRQAAFQRFGHPVDPRTGQPMSSALLPGAAEKATQLMIDWVETRYDQVTADFSQTMAERMTADGLSDAWAQLIGLVGSYERMGEAAARQAGDLTIVDIKMSFEASEMKGRVVYDKDGKVAGLFVLKPDAL